MQANTLSVEFRLLDSFRDGSINQRDLEHNAIDHLAPWLLARIIYTTNAIESINARLRKIIKTRGQFPSDDAAFKLIWLALRNIPVDWGRAAKDWK